MTKSVYVSITGLRVRHFWQVPVFWRYAIASIRQAQSADGCLDAQARTIRGVHHTRSVWRDRSAMQDYLRSGAHLKAMQIFKRIATGKVYGFETADTPDWSEVRRLWDQLGRDV